MFSIKGKRVEVSGTYNYKGTIIDIGVDYMELNDGVGAFSTFIILKDDGNIMNVNVESCVIKDI